MFPFVTSIEERTIQHTNGFSAVRMLNVFIIKLLCLTLFSISLLHTIHVQADIAIIVNITNQNQLTLTKIRKIFLAKTKAFPDGSPVKPLQTNEDEIRHEFNRLILNRSNGSINSYWARMLFSSRGKPPTIIGDAEKVKLAIAANPRAIAYINAEDIDDTVKVAMLIKNQH